MTNENDHESAYWEAESCRSERAWIGLRDEKGIQAFLPSESAMNPQPNTPASLNEAVASALLSDTDMVRIYRRVTGAARWDESAIMLMREVEHAVNEKHSAAPAAAIDAREQKTVWMPIETAPQDENILIATTPDWVMEARQDLNDDGDEQVWQWVTADGNLLHKSLVPFAWMPKPAFPQAMCERKPEGGM